MTKYTSLLFFIAVLISSQAQADLFWDDEDSVAPAELPTTPAPVINENSQTIAKHIDPTINQKNLQGKLEQKPASNPTPKAMVLPFDRTIQLRAATNNPTINKNLRVSLQSNFMKEVDRWYTAGGDVNSQDPQGRTLLYLAIQRRHVDGIEFLLLRRADAKKANENGTTPLQIAVTTGQSRVVKMLLERNATVSPLPNGETMIHYALTKGMSVIAMDLLEKGVDVNKTYSGEKSLLHIAATRNLLNPAQALLNSGANANAADNEGATPLHEAAARGHARMIRLLLSRKANIKAETERKWRPIHHAARFGHSEAVSMLLSKGASANNRTKGGKTPLSLAKHLHHESVVELLAGRTTVSDSSGSSSSRSSGWFW